jgi:hypothetical protein
MMFISAVGAETKEKWRNRKMFLVNGASRPGLRWPRRRTFENVLRIEASSISLLTLFIVLLLNQSSALGKSAAAPDRSVKRLKEIVETLRQQLLMQATIDVSVVPENRRLVSVEGSSRPGSRFDLSFDREFLNSLDDEEVVGAIAHELGHVWIYTHHPYIQTEVLANRVAMGVVSRDVLARLYTKMWTRLGTHGDLEDFLGRDAESQSTMK